MDYKLTRLPDVDGKINYEIKNMETCQKCGGECIENIGYGTERIEKIAKEIFEDYRIEYKIFENKDNYKPYYLEKTAFEAIRKEFSNCQNVEDVVNKIENLVSNFDFDTKIVKNI